MAHKMKTGGHFVDISLDIMLRKVYVEKRQWGHSFENLESV